MTPKEKALALSYVLSCLLQDNLEIVVLEMGVEKDPDAGKMRDKLTKLIGASRNAFRIIEKHAGEDLKDIKFTVEDTLDKLWTY